MKSLGRILILIVTTATVLAFFQNCGQIGFEASNGTNGFSSLHSVCEGVLKKSFEKTYFPLLSVSCNRCHENSHGSRNVNISFSNFMAKGVNTINYKATHPHGDNGQDLSNQIASIQSEWDQGQAEYTDCLSKAGNGDENLGFRLKLVSKGIVNIDETRDDQSKWKPVVWDLDQEGPANQKVLFGAYLKIDVRYYLLQGTVVGFEFRNPAMVLKTSGKIVEVNGLNLYLDDTLQSDFTTYSAISALVKDTTDTPLAPGAGNAMVYFPAAGAASLLAFEINNIKFVSEPPPPPAPEPTPNPNPGPGPAVTYTQLTSDDAMLGVFKKNCFSCHSGATAPKGLDLMDYNLAKNAASTILMRINNSAMPMPPSGLLPQADRDIVNRWVGNGAPQ